MIGIGKTTEGNNIVVYRVSSRSFPNRKAVFVDSGNSVSIEPREGAEESTNPFIKYTCAQKSSDWLVMSNGTHTDPVLKYLQEGITPEQAIADTLQQFGYERDENNTPRIVGVVSREGLKGWLGIVRDDGYEVRELTLEPGQLVYVSTYGHSSIKPAQRIAITEVESARIAEAMIKSDEVKVFDNPVTAVAGVATGRTFILATYDHSAS